MILLDQFISQTGRQPAEWTGQDIQSYLDYVQAHVADITVSKRYESLSRKPDLRHSVASLRESPERSEGSFNRGGTRDSSRRPE
jgi:hypothetical protein